MPAEAMVELAASDGMTVRRTLTPMQQAVLTAVCDTLLPALDPPHRGVAEDYFARSASDRGIPGTVIEAVGFLEPHVQAAIVALLDRLAGGFLDLPDDAARTAGLHAAVGDAPTRLALKQLKAMVFGLLVARFDEHGRNPDWPAIGYPGPASPPPPPEQAPKTIPVLQVTGASSSLRADVCVIGSGAGGSVIASELARAGRSVIVLEGGGYRNEADFHQLELLGMTELFLNGGLLWSETGSLALMAGATLGGGTVVNSLACLRPPDAVRSTWAQMGLDDVDTVAFDAQLDAVWTRLGVNTEATKHNGQTDLMLRGLEARGMSYEPMPRNASLNDDERFCGYCNSGCQLGCKRSTLLTYLQDAANDGARFVVNCKADRVLVDGGRATGVEAVITHRSGTETRVTVHAPEVVVAAGSIESPAILLRSGIGGPAVGQHLQVHPAYFVTGVYDEVVNAWSGQILSAVSFDRVHARDGGYLIETLGLSPALVAGSSPWSDGRRHREALLALPHTAAWAAICHDYGEGQVVLGPDRRPLVRWELDDPLDRDVARRSQVELALIHHAAGAREIYTFQLTEQRWCQGQDFEAYIERVRATPTEDLAPSSAHQMSSCRMGSDPQTSVADGRGELHDVPGVWIGDASALPTAPGVNPMITIMALARRTASYMLAA